MMPLAGRTALRGLLIRGYAAVSQGAAGALKPSPSFDRLGEVPQPLAAGLGSGIGSAGSGVGQAHGLQLAAQLKASTSLMLFEQARQLSTPALSRLLMRMVDWMSWGS
jgi:hypothetical protein